MLVPLKTKNCWGFPLEVLYCRIFNMKDKNFALKFSFPEIWPQNRLQATRNWLIKLFAIGWVSPATYKNSEFLPSNLKMPNLLLLLKESQTELRFSQNQTSVNPLRCLWWSLLEACELVGLTKIRIVLGEKFAEFSSFCPDGRRQARSAKWTNEWTTCVPKVALNGSLVESLSLYYEVGSTKGPRFKALGASLKVKKVAEWTSLDVLRQKVQR